jgi:hypothetical protein
MSTLCSFFRPLFFCPFLFIHFFVPFSVTSLSFSFSSTSTSSSSSSSLKKTALFKPQLYLENSAILHPVFTSLDFATTIFLQSKVVSFAFNSLTWRTLFLYLCPSVNSSFISFSFLNFLSFISSSIPSLF